MMAYIGFVESLKPIPESIGIVFKNSQVSSTVRYLHMDTLGRFMKVTDPTAIYTPAHKMQLDLTLKFYSCKDLSLKIKNPDLTAAIVHSFT